MTAGIPVGIGSGRRGRTTLISHAVGKPATGTLAKQRQAQSRGIHGLRVGDCTLTQTYPTPLGHRELCDVWVENGLKLRYMAATS